MNKLWTPWRMPYLQGEHERPKGCVFCHKATCPNEPEQILHRGESCYVALNRYPYSNGHLLIIPYAHVSSLEDLDAQTLTEMMLSVNLCLAALREAYAPQGFNVGVNLGTAAGAGIADHVHMHVVPRWKADTNFMSVIGDTRVIVEMLDQAYARLNPIFAKLGETG
jgi:ATP adenylyltransferase